MKHLSRSSRIALGYGKLRPAIAIVLGRISIGPSHRRHSRASATNESCFLGDGNPRLKRPISNLSCGRSRAYEGAQSLVFQRVGHDGFQDSARRLQRHVIIASLEGASAISVSLLDDRSEFEVMNEVEAVGRRRCG